MDAIFTLWQFQADTLNYRTDIANIGQYFVRNEAWAVWSAKYGYQL